MLDAQYFGIPQRRRRVFVISCFDSSIATRCPEQILTVGESRGGDSSKGKPKGQGVADTVTESVRESGQPFTPSSHAGYSDGIGTLRANGGDLGGGQRNIVGSLQARDYKGVGNQYVMENKLVVQQTPPSAK